MISPLRAVIRFAASTEKKEKPEEAVPFFTRNPTAQTPPSALANKLEQLKQQKESTLSPTQCDQLIRYAEERIASTKSSLAYYEKQLAVQEAELKRLLDSRDNPVVVLDKVVIQQNDVHLTNRELMTLIAGEAEKHFPNLTTGLGGYKISWKDAIIPPWPLIKLMDRTATFSKYKYHPKKVKGLYEVQLKRLLPISVHPQVDKALKELTQCGYLQSETHEFEGSWNSLKVPKDAFWVLTDSGKKALLSEPAS